MSLLSMYVYIPLFLCIDTLSAVLIHSQHWHWFFFFFKLFSEFIHTHHKPVSWKAKIIQKGKKNVPNDWYIQLSLLCGDMRYSKCNAGNQSTGQNLVIWNIILINEFIWGTVDLMTNFFFPFYLFIFFLLTGKSEVRLRNTTPI